LETDGRFPEWRRRVEAYEPGRKAVDVRTIEMPPGDGRTVNKHHVRVNRVNLGAREGGSLGSSRAQSGRLKIIKKEKKGKNLKGHGWNYKVGGWVQSHLILKDPLEYGYDPESAVDAPRLLKMAKICEVLNRKQRQQQARGGRWGAAGAAAGAAAPAADGTNGAAGSNLQRKLADCKSRYPPTWLVTQSVKQG